MFLILFDVVLCSVCGFGSSNHKRQWLESHFIVMSSNHTRRIPSRSPSTVKQAKKRNPTRMTARFPCTVGIIEKEPKSFRRGTEIKKTLACIVVRPHKFFSLFSGHHFSPDEHPPPKKTQAKQTTSSKPKPPQSSKSLSLSVYG